MQKKDQMTCPNCTALAAQVDALKTKLANLEDHSWHKGLYVLQLQKKIQASNDQLNKIKDFISSTCTQDF